MNDIQLEAYEKWKRYIGCGNPEAKIWIVGIEEGGEIKPKPGQSTEDSVLDYFESTISKYNQINIERVGEIYFQTNEKTTNTGENGLYKPSPVWSGTYTILKNLIHNPSKCIIRRNSDVFISNIFPLGNHKLSKWEYEKSIGLSKKQYIFDMVSARSELFQSLIKDKIVIFQGKTYWNDAYKIFGINENEFEHEMFYKSYLWLKVHKDKRIIFTRHFSNGMPSILIDEVIKNIKKWL